MENSFKSQEQAITNKRKPLDFKYIQDQAMGNYVSRIFPAVGINLGSQPNKHQPCPLCGGRDRFRCDDKGGSGSWICNQCGAGNGFSLVREYTGGDSYDTFALIAEVLGIDGGKAISEADKKAWREAQAKREQADREAKRQARLQAATVAQERYNSAPALTQHAYLTKKHIDTPEVKAELRIDRHGKLLIPVYYHNTETGAITLCNVQSIDDNGTKLFVKDALKKEAFFVLSGGEQDNSVVFVATGFATAASIYMAMEYKHPVFVTFDDGNMINCAYKIRTLYPHSRLIFCADDDHKTALNTGKNSGLEAGRRCAEMVQAEFISPDFGGDARITTGELTDFNDLHCAFGLDVVKWQISYALNNKPRDLQRQDMGLDADAKLDKLLKTYAFITEIGKKSNKIYNLIDKIEMTKTQFEQDLGDKELANRWYYHPNKQTISRQQVRAELAETTAIAFADIFEQFWYIQGTKEVYNHETGERWPIDTLRLDRPLEYDIWLKSDRRQKVKNTNIWFDPTRKRKPKESENYINTFKGLPLAPFNNKELSEMMGFDNATNQQIEAFLYGVVTPFIQLIHHLCGDDAKDGELVNWILNWIAIPLQQPGTKMDTALIFHGHIQGAGKSLFFDRIMRRIYGDYALTLGQGQLASQYNDWVEGKLFAVFEEIFEGKDRYAHMGMIKQLITGDTVYINKKFVSGWTQDNFVNTVFLSNDMQPLSLEENDRRHVVMYPTATLPTDLQAQIADALDDPKNWMLRAFYTYLMVKDVGHQNAHTKAIATTAKTRLQEISMASWERFYTYWKRGELEVPYMTCLTSDLYDYYVYWCKKNGERATSSTKLLTFVSLREHKQRIRYSYQLQNGDQMIPRSGQGMALIIGMDDKTPDQNLYGVLVSRFKSAIIQAQSFNGNTNSNINRNFGSHENSNPFI